MEVLPNETTISSPAPSKTRLIPRGDVGPITIATIAALYLAIWLFGRPAGEPWRSYIGQMLGAESILLLSLALVLISTLPWVETWFHGIDRAAIWHRRIAITGMVLLVPHILMASNPHSSHYGPALGTIGAVGLGVLVVWSILPRWRMMLPSFLTRSIVAVSDRPVGTAVRWLLGNYERWRMVHRLTGLFVAAAVAHALLDATPFGDSQLLRWTFIATGCIGLAFYLYRELLARRFWPFHDYQIDGVSSLGSDLFEISLIPLGKPVDFRPGQFVTLYVESNRGWQHHPFTISSAPKDPVVRFTVKALGDYTSQIESALQPGMPAVIGSPHGKFDWQSGSHDQIWIGAGVGVTPFLSWLRSLDETFDRDVIFFYTARGDAPFADEILEIKKRHPSLRVRIVDTSNEGHLSPAGVLAEAGAPPRQLSVFMCGPESMLKIFKSAFRQSGVRRSEIHFEYFNIR